ncbi:hypothetical protein SFRURICE_008114 [Spodoptera frugiperda]|nr:hypothetical protein SFRURICE_008114 [Spodoptera frugiperda]
MSSLVRYPNTYIHIVTPLVPEGVGRGAHYDTEISLKHYFKISNDGVSCSFFSIRSYTLERAPSFTDRQTDGQFNLTFQKCLI